MTKLEELTFTETKAMMDYARTKHLHYTQQHVEIGGKDASKWESYEKDLESSLEAKIRFALGKS